MGRRQSSGKVAIAVAMAVVVAFRGSGVRGVDAALDAFFVLTNQFGLTKRTGPVGNHYMHGSVLLHKPKIALYNPRGSYSPV